MKKINWLNSFSSLSLSWKLSIFFVGIVLLMGWLTIFFHESNLTEMFHDELDARGVTISRNLAANSIEPILTDDIMRLQLLLNNLMENEPQIRYIYILTPNNQILVHTFVRGFPKKLAGLNIPQPGRKYRHQLLRIDGRNIHEISAPIAQVEAGSVHVGLSDKQIGLAATSTKRNILLITVFVSIIGVFLALILSRVITRPLADLTRGAQELGRGNLDYRIPVKAHDETGLLAETFNQMAEDLSTDIIKLQGTEKALRQKEGQYRTLLESTVAIPWELDLTTNEFTYVGPQAEKTLGYPVEDWKNLDYWAQLIHPDDREYALRFCAEATVHGGYHEFEYRMVTTDGDIRWIREFITVVKENDQPVLLAGFLFDITKHVLMEEEREKLQEKLIQAQKMEAIGRLAGGVAHDFNNILSSVIGYSELALQRLAPESESHDFLEIIHESGLKASALTKQLLAFSRKQIMDMKGVDLNELCSNLLRMLTRLIGEDIKLEMKARATGNIWADPNQMEQILMNLAVNARDAMPDGGQLIIETSDREIGPGSTKEFPGIKPGSYVKLIVKDTGIGMSCEVLENIFDPFYTTKERGKGTGLGLATVYGIVRQHNGYIYVTSRPGKGACFNIYLPVHEGEDVHEEEDSLTDLPNGEETILVVEDERQVSELIVAILEPLGYTLLTAANGEEALAINARHNGIDLLLTDVIMPGMNGRELAVRILADQPKIKTIYMSGYTDDVISRHGVLEPGFTLLNKPISVLNLAKCIRNALDEK